MAKLELVPYKGHFFKNYQSFAAKNWGQDTYKGYKAYLDWLYKENPSTQKKDTDFLVLTSNNEDVLGVIHKMHVPWMVNGQEIEIPAIHNLLVEKKYQAGHGNRTG